MFNFRRKKTQPPQPLTAPVSETGGLVWDNAARTALNQAAAQAPVPRLLKNKLRSELKKAAEQKTRAAGRTHVTPEDLMQGLLEKLPANMRQKIENAVKEGPAGLQKLEQEFKKGKS